MKRIATMFLTLAAALVVIGCSSGATEDDTKVPVSDKGTEGSKNDMSTPKTD